LVHRGFGSAGPKRRRFGSNAPSQLEPWRGNEAQEGEGNRRLATGGGRPVSDGGARPRGRGSSLQSFRACSERRKGRHNGEEATVAVMRCGYQRENFFEGCEGRSEERCGRPDASQSLFGGIGRRAEAAEAKRGEPLPVPGCNKPGTLMRSKPSRWCETTRMERADRVEPACRRRWRHRREWTQESMSEEGRSSHDESHERQGPEARATASEALRAHPGRSEDEARYMRGA
jgi:hypothetical protein